MTQVRMTGASGVIKLRVPVRLDPGTEITFHVQMTDQDARALLAAPRRTVRHMDAGMVALFRDGLAKFFESEEVPTPLEGRQALASLPEGTRVTLILADGRRDVTGELKGTGERGLTISQGLGQQTYGWEEISGAETFDDQL